jgi:hypothetical protein
MCVWAGENYYSPMKDYIGVSDRRARGESPGPLTHSERIARRWIQGDKVSSSIPSPSSTKYVYIKSTTVFIPSSELGLSQPLSRQRMCPSPQNRGEGGHTCLRVGDWGSPNSDDWRKGLALLHPSPPSSPSLYFYPLPFPLLTSSS